MSARIDSSLVRLAILFLALVLVGCGGNGSGSGDKEGKGNDSGTTSLKEALSKPLGKSTNCPNLTLSRTRAVPGQEVVVSGLPTEFDAINVRVIAEADNGQTLVDPLFVSIDDESGEIAFSAPVHPSGNLEGGRVKLEAGDGELHCPQQTLALEPLPSAPADHPVVIADKFETWADLSIQTLGYDPQTLLNADPDSLPEARLSLWLVKQFVSGDRDGALPVLARQARDGDGNRLARLLMASGLEEALDQAITELRMTAGARLEPLSLNQWSRELTHARKPGVAPAVASISPTASCEEQAFDPDELQINTASELSERMKAADSGTLLSDASNTAVGRTLGTFGLADSSGPVGTTSGFLGVGQVVGTNLEAARRALEPQRITEFSVETVQREWVEDRPRNDLLFWDGARVRAEGDAFNLGQATLESLVAALGMTPGPLGTATTAASTVAPGSVSDAVSDLTEDSCVRIRAPEYGPIDVDDMQWTESEIVGSTVELAGDGHQEYRGVDIGASTLDIDLKAEPFALVAPLTASFVIDVVQVNTSRIPRSVNVTQPGEQVQLSVTGTNPYVEDNRDNYSASLPDGTGVIFDQRGDGDQYNVTYKAPSEREDYPAEVLFTANHETLPVGRDPRTYTVAVNLGGELSINEDTVCLTPGEQTSFSAKLDGFAAGNRSVSWQTSAGSINSTGDLTASYQAPGSPVGAVDITAVADADGSVTDTITINVSESCIEKKWFPTAGIRLDGNGSYGTCPNRSPGDNPDRQEKTLETLNPPDPSELAFPGDYWFDRTRDTSADLVHSSTRRVYEDQECLSVALAGANEGTLEYSAQGNNLSASAESTVNSECRDYGNGEIACVEAGTTMGLSGAFYIDLTERRAFTLEGELSCPGGESGTAGSLFVGQGSSRLGVGLTADVARYDSAGDPVVPPQGGGTGVENPNGTLRPPRLYDITCDVGETVPVSVDFVLTAPPAGQTHRVVINLQGGLSIGPTWPFANPDGTPTGPPTTGNFTGEAEVDFSMSLFPN
jgi:hypothetical protein